MPKRVNVVGSRYPSPGPVRNGRELTALLSQHREDRDDPRCTGAPGRYVATEPRFKKIAGDTSSARLRVAYTARRRDKETGEWGDGPTSFVTIQCWRTLADNVSMSVHKGEPVLITGRLQIRRFEDAEGAPRTAVEVEAASVGHDLTRGVAQFSRTRWPATTAATGAAALPEGASGAGEGTVPGEGGGTRQRTGARRAPEWGHERCPSGRGRDDRRARRGRVRPGAERVARCRGRAGVLRRTVPRMPGQRPKQACPPDRRPRAHGARGAWLGCARVTGVRGCTGPVVPGWGVPA